MADTGKKQVPLRLSAKLYEAIAAWVKQRNKNGKYVSDTIDEPLELDIK